MKLKYNGTDEHVNYLRWPPIELIEDAEKALKDE